MMKLTVFAATVATVLAAPTSATAAPCWDRPSCALSIAQYRAGVVAPAKQPKLWHAFMSWLENGILPQLHDHGGDAAPHSTKTDATNYCADNGPYEFIPVHVGTVWLNTNITIDLTDGEKGFDACYSKMTVSYSTHAPGGQEGGESWGYVHFERGVPKSLTCDDFYGVSSKFNSQTLDISVAGSILKPMHINYTYSPHEFRDILKNGLAINVAPCGLAGTVTSALATAGLFTGKDVEENNKKFLVSRGLFPKFETFGKITPVDEKLIKSGDVLQVLKLDGLDPLIAWGTGGRTGHTTIAVWEDDELYVCESTDASPTGAYWPPPYGIIRHKFSSWLALAEKADFSVVILPLSEEAAGWFDVTAFWAWYRLLLLLLLFLLNSPFTSPTRYSLVSIVPPGHSGIKHAKECRTAITSCYIVSST
jgi:hypothetical protein